MLVNVVVVVVVGRMSVLLMFLFSTLWVLMWWWLWGGVEEDDQPSHNTTAAPQAGKNRNPGREWYHLPTVCAEKGERLARITTVWVVGGPIRNFVLAVDPWG